MQEIQRSLPKSSPVNGGAEVAISLEILRLTFVTDSHSVRVLLNMFCGYKVLYATEQPLAFFQIHPVSKVLVVSFITSSKVVLF
jgi:hypothetical protein